MKEFYVKDIKPNVKFNSTFMIKKKLPTQDGSTLAYVGDKTGDIKISLTAPENTYSVGDVILIIGKHQDKEIKKFVHGIGGLSQHHAYIGGLAEHTLNVMYMTKVMAYRYNCTHKEIAILAAKLHDIGKVEEYYTNGPFSVTMRGEMEGHIVIAINMLEEAFKSDANIYSEDFKSRIKGCIVQHHGKVEYGSPKVPNTEEAFIVHHADYVDANLNKIAGIKENINPGNWSEYDRRIGTRIFV